MPARIEFENEARIIQQSYYLNKENLWIRVTIEKKYYKSTRMLSILNRANYISCEMKMNSVSLIK